MLFRDYFLIRQGSMLRFWNAFSLSCRLRLLLLSRRLQLWESRDGWCIRFQVSVDDVYEWIELIRVVSSAVSRWSNVPEYIGSERFSSTHEFQQSTLLMNCWAEKRGSSALQLVAWIVGRRMRFQPSSTLCLIPMLINIALSSRRHHADAGHLIVVIWTILPPHHSWF
jgi:hypothetical protein